MPLHRQAGEEDRHDAAEVKPIGQKKRRVAKDLGGRASKGCHESTNNPGPVGELQRCYSVCVFDCHRDPGHGCATLHKARGQRNGNERSYESASMMYFAR